MLERYLLVWLCLSSWLAYAWPRLAGKSWDPFTASKPSLPWLIAISMFAIGLMLPRDEVRQVLRRWPQVLAGTGLQYVCMPALAYAMGLLWGLEEEQFVGMVMVGCVPGAMASNLLTLNARGNASYSVSLTTAATMLSPIAVPLALTLTLSASSWEQVHVLLRAAYLLALTVVLPVVAGHLTARNWPRGEPHFRRGGTLLANLVILWIIAVVVGLNRERLAGMAGPVLGALLCVNLGGYLAGYLGGFALRIPEAMRRALTLEIGMQNAGLGATLATQLFPEQPAVAIAPAMYTFGCMLTGAALARYWQARGGDQESISTTAGS